MIHDIEPRIFSNKFINMKSQPNDLFLSYEGDLVLVREEKDKLWYPSFADYRASHPNLSENAKDRKSVV